MLKKLRDGIRLLEHLLLDAEGERRYWDRFDCLNSDGRRLFHRVAKILVDEVPWLRRLLYEARRNPCRENLERLLERVRSLV